MAKGKEDNHESFFDVFITSSSRQEYDMEDDIKDTTAEFFAHNEEILEEDQTEESIKEKQEAMSEVVYEECPKCGVYHNLKERC